MREKLGRVRELHLLVSGIKSYLNDFMGGGRDRKYEGREGWRGEGEKVNGWMDG